MKQFIWNQISTAEFDYQTLMHVLKNYSKPRDKVTALMRQGVIRRIKKGLYVFGAGYGRQPFSRELLSNLIYGPSYVSLEAVLQAYSLIPERVATMTAVSMGPSRRFSTPVGLFTYRKVPAGGFNFGVERIVLDDQRAYLMANAEKALADRIKLAHGVSIRNQGELRRYLIEELRIDWDGLLELDVTKLAKYAVAYRSFKLEILVSLLQREQSQREAVINE